MCKDSIITEKRHYSLDNKDIEYDFAIYNTIQLQDRYPNFIGLYETDEHNIIKGYITGSFYENQNRINIFLVIINPKFFNKGLCKKLLKLFIEKYSFHNNKTYDKFSLYDGGDKFPIKNNTTKNTISYSCLCYIKTFAEHVYDAFISNDKFEKIGVEPITIENCKTSKRTHSYLIFHKKKLI